MKRLLSAFFLCALASGLAGSQGLSLRVEGKSPLLVALESDGDSEEAISLRETLLYLGGSLEWSPLSKTARVSLNGKEALLMLGESRAYEGETLFQLPSPLRWQDGKILLGRAALEGLLQSLDPQAPTFESATAEELGSLKIPEATPEAEPTLAATTETAAAPELLPNAEPSLETGHEPSVGASPAGPSVRCVVIDAGHGGQDPGARGPEGYQEKDVCLDIALKIRARMAERFPGIRVILTRDNDYFKTLRQRTQIANEAKADLFISIHNNASPDSHSQGSQVFFYDSRSSDKAAEDLARRENEDANYLEFIMTDLAKSLVRDQSIMLGQAVQDQLAPLRKEEGIHRRSLSYAPFYVLARTRMPAILVEVAFITNPREERLLVSNEFRQDVADGIVDGIGKYRDAMKDQ